MKYTVHFLFSVKVNKVYLRRIEIILYLNWFYYSPRILYIIL